MNQRRKRGQQKIERRRRKIRPASRLDSFYDELKKIHKEHFCDWRFGQLCSNFFGWLASEKKVDLFFPEEDEMVELFKEYANSNSMWYQGWDLLNKQFFMILIQES